MDGCFAIVAYRCYVDGVLQDSLDFQVRWFSMTDKEKIQKAIQVEPHFDYLNDAQQTVRSELAEILAVDLYPPKQSGDEVIGFVTNAAELSSLFDPSSRRSEL